MLVERSSFRTLRRLPESSFITEVAHNPSIPQIDSLTDSDSVRTSLAHYGEYLRRDNGELATILEQHKNKNKTVSPYFTVATPLPKDDAKLPNSSFFIDGEYGLGLGVKKKKSSEFVWTAVTSFSPHPHDKRAPLITQLQARWFWQDSFSDEGHLLLDNYRWEFALVNLVTLWALRAGLENIYIQAGEQNSFANTIGRESAKMRYDITAKRLGFKKDLKSNAYKLSLKS